MLNKNEEYIIDMNIELGKYLRLLDYTNPYKAKEKFFNAINYPNDFAFIAQHFENSILRTIFIMSLFMGQEIYI